MQSTYPRTVTTRVRLKDRELVQLWQAIDDRHTHFVQVPAENIPELIRWEDNGYLREPSGWYRKELNRVPVDLSAIEGLPQVLRGTLSAATRLADSVLDGVAVQRYAGQVSFQDAVGVYEGSFELWLSSSLPVRSTFKGSYAGHALSIDSHVDYRTVPTFTAPRPVLNPE